MQLNELLRKTRIEKNLTQEYVADQIGVSSRTLSRIENNLRSPKYDELKNIFKVLAMPQTMVFGESCERNLLIKPKEFGDKIDVISKIIVLERELFKLKSWFLNENISL